jgi:rifampin ADP-ribosylating transferase
MLITDILLKSHNACNDGMKWVTKNGLIGLECKDFMHKLIENEKYEWGNWLITRVLSKIGNVKYAIFAAEQVLEIYEKQYPDDKRPRKAIEAAKKYIENPSADAAARSAAARSAAARSAAARSAADAAARSAADAADAAYAADAADAADAAYAAYAAARSAADAADAADAAYAAYVAARSAADAADAAYVAARSAADAIKVKILNYGIELLEKESV